MSERDRGETERQRDRKRGREREREEYMKNNPEAAPESKTMRRRRVLAIFFATRHIVCVPDRVMRLPAQSFVGAAFLGA